VDRYRYSTHITVTGNDAKTVFKSQRSSEVPLFKVEPLMCRFKHTYQVACNYEEYRLYRRDTMAPFVLVPCQHYVRSSRHSTSTTKNFHVVPARWHSCGPACCRARANPPPRQRLGEEEEEVVASEERKRKLPRWREGRRGRHPRAHPHLELHRWVDP
jgi:hypothetical protein